MRLGEIERGDTLGHRALIGMISLVARMRLPDAARVAFYHQNIMAGTMGTWTQTALRGPSPWSISERELMAALVAVWNTCPFCIGAHSAIAIRGMPRDAVEAALADYRTAPLPGGLIATLVFLEKMTRTPADLTGNDARAVLAAGVSRDALTDAMAVAAIFNIIARYANALDFAIPSAAEYARSATMLLKRGYGSAAPTGPSTDGSGAPRHVSR
jgi:AhpD family alkylhydroperoxidase